jgi:hypothetical protein
MVQSISKSHHPPDLAPRDSAPHMAASASRLLAGSWCGLAPRAWSAGVVQEVFLQWRGRGRRGRLQAGEWCIGAGAGVVGGWFTGARRRRGWVGEGLGELGGEAMSTRCDALYSRRMPYSRNQGDANALLGPAA